jgi:hypothetical protein
MKNPGAKAGARVGNVQSPKNDPSSSPEPLKNQALTGGRNKPPRLEEGTSRSIYDGQERVGHLVRRGPEFVAYDRQRRPIGTYAAAAVLGIPFTGTLAGALRRQTRETDR